MRKKLCLSFVLALLLVLAFCATAAATNGQCGDNVYWAKDENGVVTLSGTGPTYNYYWSGNLSPFDHDATVTAVIVEPGVTTLGECLFYNCENLASISLPDGLTFVRWLSLYGTALTELRLPASVTGIDSLAVSRSVLESVYVYNPDMVFPEGQEPIEGINGMTFYGYPGSTTETYVKNAFFTYYFKDITIHITVYSCGDHAYWAKDENGVVTISGTGPMWDNWRYSASGLDNESPFHNDTSVTAAVIKPGVTTLGRNTFDGCANLTSVSLPDGLERVNHGSLYGTGLSELVLPASVTEIEGNALGGNTLTDVYVYNPDMSFGVSLDPFNGNGTTFHGYAGSTTETFVKNAWTGYNYRFEPFPDPAKQCGDDVYWEMDENGVVTISGTGPMWDYQHPSPNSLNPNPSPFESDDTVTAAVIESGVTTVGAAFFYGCQNLASVELPAGLTSLGNDTFYGCTSLASVELPASLTSLGEGAFCGCTSLASVELPAGLTSMGGYTFYGCTSLASVELPAGLTSLGNETFNGCTSLASVEFPAGLTSLGYGAFGGCTSLASVELPAGLTTIGGYTFCGCASLASIELPSGLTSLGQRAFSSCTSLVSVKLPAGLTSLGGGAFYGCPSLASVELPASLTSIGNETFYGCTSLASIELPFGLTSLGNWTFSYCTSLVSVKLPAGLTSLDSYTFCACTALASIELPASLASLGNYTFYGCTALASIELPAGLTSLGNYTFSGCTSLEAVRVLNPDTVFGEYVFQGAAANLTIYGYTGSTAQSYAAANNHTFVVIPVQCGDNVFWVKDENGVVTVSGTGPMWDYQFSSNSNLSPFDADDTVTAAVIESGVTTVGAWFFNECHSLASVSFPTGLTTIGNYAFYGCTSLASTSFPAGLTSLGEGAFYGCTSLASVSFPAGLTSLGNGAFYGCTSLVSASFPAGLTTIGNYAFYGCTDLASAALPAGLTSIGTGAFSDCTSITSIELPASLSNIDYKAFCNCTALETVRVLGTGTDFGVNVFQDAAANLTIYGYTGSTAETYAAANSIPFVSLGDPPLPSSGQCGDNVFWALDTETGVLTITGTGPMWDYTFSEASPFCEREDVKAVVIEIGVTTVGAFMFHRCAKLRSVDLPASVTQIGIGAFNYCAALDNVVIPDGVTSVNGFSYCTSLRHITLPDSVTGIAPAAFYGSTGLTSLDFLPDTLTVIGYNAFRDCTGLLDAIIPPRVFTVGNGAFAGCTGLGDVTVYNPTVMLGENVFSDCGSMALHGFPGSTAESYAKDNILTFYPLYVPFFLPAALTTLEDEAFSGAAARCVVIPKTVTTIEGDPFADTLVGEIFGYPGTAAETFANAYADARGYLFIPIDDAWLAAMRG